MRTVYKNILITALLTAATLVATIAQAGSGKVTGGKHDFSPGAPGASQWGNPPAGTLGGQVCIYCHTPHSAGQTRLLWNKASNGNVNFRLYTSSPTLSSVTRTASSLDSNSPSLLCLSCHDGKTAMNVLHAGAQGSLATAATPPLSDYPVGSRLVYGTTPKYMQSNGYDIITGEPLPGGPMLGGSSGDDLTNDHPIGFSYTAAQSEKTASSLHSITDVGTKSGNTIRFFGSTKKVECSSCHDPHIENNQFVNPKQVPFLVMDNDGSKLCLACHNK